MFYNLLKDIKVIEYGNLISAPFCARILADLGATVIKIEKPSVGDDSRRLKPFLQEGSALQISGLFQYLNLNKLDITLNLDSEKGKKIFTELLKGTDVVVENIAVKRKETLGLTYSLLKEVKPGVIITSITPFGQTGPYRDYKGCELISSHMGGVGYASTREVQPDQEPIKLPAHIHSFQAGLSAAVATMGAIFRHKLTGAGTWIDVSEQESVIQNLAITLARYSYAKQIVSRTDVLDRAPFHILPCKDGYIYHAFVHEYQWTRFVELMGKPDWAENELFKDYASRGMYWDALKPLMVEWTSQHTMDEIYHESQKKGAPIGAVYTAKNIMESEQFKTRGFFVSFENQSKEVKFPGIPYAFSALKKEKPEPAPSLGQHNEQVYGIHLGYTIQEINKLKTEGVI